jgi:hypothetical protein
MVWPNMELQTNLITGWILVNSRTIGRTHKIIDRWLDLIIHLYLIWGSNQARSRVMGCLRINIHLIIQTTMALPSSTKWYLELKRGKQGLRVIWSFQHLLIIRRTTNIIINTLPSSTQELLTYVTSKAEIAPSNTPMQVNHFTQNLTRYSKTNIWTSNTTHWPKTTL